jgi:hypothetical protein
METLIVQPKTKEQLAAIKSILKALNIDFKSENSINDFYSSEFNAKMKRGKRVLKQEGQLR